MAVYVAGDEPRREGQPSLLGRIVRLLLEFLRHARARTAVRELRRYQHLIHRDDDADKT